MSSSPRVAGVVAQLRPARVDGVAAADNTQAKMSSMTFLAEDASEDDRQSARESSYGASDASESPNDRMSRLSISRREEAVHIEIATANLRTCGSASLGRRAT